MLLKQYRKFLDKLSGNSSKYLLLSYTLGNIILLLLIFSCIIYLFHKKNKFDNVVNTLYEERQNISRFREIAVNLSRNVEYYKSFKTSELQNDSLLIDDINKSLLTISHIKESNEVDEIHFQEHINALLTDYVILLKENELLLEYLAQLGDEESGIYYKLLSSVKEFMKKYQDSENQHFSVKGIDQILFSIRLLNTLRDASIISTIQNWFEKISNNFDQQETDSSNYMQIRVSDALLNVKFVFKEYARKSMEIGIDENNGVMQRITERTNKIEFRINESIKILQEVKYQRLVLTLVFLIIFIFIYLILNASMVILFMNREKNSTDLFDTFISNLSKGNIFNKKEKLYRAEISPFIERLESFSIKFLNAKKSLEAFAQGNHQLSLDADKHFPHLHRLFIQLRELNEQMQKEVADEKRLRQEMVWTKTGIDALTEVMRRQYDNPLMHANEIINMLVEYLQIPIGAIYLVKIENNIKYVEMVSAFAYGKEKQMYRKILFGEGIIGTAASEQKTLNITNIPENYFNIVSGFGESKPKNIIACPIKLNQDLYGVIELSSLTKFKDEEIHFIEEVCKTVAFSFAISKVYVDTLTQFENSHLQIAELEAENESLVNDYKELNSNFKQLLTHSSDNEFIISRLNELTYRASIDLDGNILESNQNFEQLFKADRKKYIQSNYREYMGGMKSTGDFDIEYLWREVRAGIQQDFETGIMIGNEEIWLEQHLFPYKDELGRVRKIQLMAFNITERIRLRDEIEKLKAD